MHPLEKLNEDELAVFHRLTGALSERAMLSGERGPLSERLHACLTHELGRRQGLHDEPRLDGIPTDWTNAVIGAALTELWVFMSMKLTDAQRQVVSLLGGELVARANRRLTAQLVSEAEAAERLGVSAQQFGQLKKEPAFPRPIALGRRVVRWDASQLESYVSSKTGRG